MSRLGILRLVVDASSILNYREASLVVQWLRLYTSTAGDVDLISGQRTKIPHATWYSQKETNKKSKAENTQNKS